LCDSSENIDSRRLKHAWDSADGTLSDRVPFCEAIEVGATAKPSPELYTDGVAFAERTGQLNDWRELLNLGMEPDTVGGGFFSGKADVVRNFVRRDPVYHIITFVGPNRYVNRFVAGPRTLYFLADGDADPKLVCYPFLALDWHLVFEDAICKSLAMLKDIKNRRQTKG
jgi:hypothetical protein